jgi:hypothetical protein
MYPTIQEKAIADEAEKMMVETMARYDPSHDKYHGKETDLHGIQNRRPREAPLMSVRKKPQKSASNVLFFRSQKCYCIQECHIPTL